MNTQSTRGSASDLGYAVVYAGAIGSAVIASLFLVLDTVAGRPLETPILMGSALFLGELPSGSGPLRLDLAAMYSLLHFGMFTAVGAVFALVAVRLREMPSLPVMLAAGLFVTLQAGLVTLNALVGPDLIAAVGLTPVVLGNLSAAGAMTAFYLRAFEIGDARLPVPTTLIGDSE
jgi:hypothetical protein